MAPNIHTYDGNGRDVALALWFIRHGDKDKEGFLTEEGRARAREVAKRASSQDPTVYDQFWGIGSDAGNKNDGRMPRARETAQIFLAQFSGIKGHPVAMNPQLSYKSILTPDPFDYEGMLAELLPKDIAEMPLETQVAERQKADTLVINYWLSNPKTRPYMRELAGGFAKVIENQETIVPGLMSGTRALVPAGTHSVMLESLLTEAMFVENQQGQTVHYAPRSLDIIGGAFKTAEGYKVKLATDEEGRNMPLEVRFDSPDRNPLKDGRTYLDRAVLRALRQEYDALHK
jgi:hypothetical protein